MLGEQRPCTRREALEQALMRGPHHLALKWQGVACQTVLDTVDIWRRAPSRVFLIPFASDTTVITLSHIQLDSRSRVYTPLSQHQPACYLRVHR